MMADFYQMNEAGQTGAMAALASAALPLWSLQGSELALIKYRENAVFKVTTQEGASYALRIHRHAYHSESELQSELQWMAALDAAGIAVPPIVPACDGALFVAVQVAAVPEPRQVDIFEWVEGRQLGLVEEGVADPAGVSEVYGTIGQLAARLHNQAIGWALPQEFTRHAWDVAGLVGEAPFWGPFWELASLTAEEKKLLLRARERARIDLTAYAGVPANDEYYSLIHADFVAENLMVDGETVRLIDFDDAGFGWHLFELATALYFEMEEDYYPQAYSALVAGYRQHRPLPDSQLEQLPLFLLVRSFTYLGWAHTRSETQTAQELVPMFTRRACALARDYLDNAASP